MTSSPLPVISVGNITAGGSGKTPFVLWLSETLQRNGFQPVILCRGDGGASRKPLLVTPDSDPATVGDEARLLADKSSCSVIAARDRIAGSRLAEGHGNLLIIDDGFQYRHLHRCCDIVLIPAEGLGNAHMIPAGPLREPVKALARADIIVRTGKGRGKTLTPSREWRWSAQPGAIEDIMHSGEKRPDTLFAVTAIARPARFFNDLESQGITLSGKKVYPDHHCFSSEDVEALTKLQQPVAVTAKDAVKLASIWPRAVPLWVLQQQGDGEKGLVEAIETMLKREK